VRRRALGDDAGTTTTTWANRFAFLFLLFLARDRSFAIPAWHVSLVRFDFFDFPRRDINGARDNGFRALADGGFGRTHEYWTPTF
jgi:hypothetical protein